MSESSQTAAIRHVYERTVPATVEDVWRALTDPDDVQRYYYDQVVESSWMPGEPVRYLDQDGVTMIEGTVLETDEPHRLVHSFAFTAAAEPAAADDPSTRVTWSIEPEAEGTRIVLVHDGFDSETATWRTVEDGWDQILDGLVELFEE